MKKQHWYQSTAVLLAACLALLLNSCLGGGGSDGGGGGGANAPATQTIATNANGEVTLNNNTYTLVDELGAPQANVEITIDTGTGLAEVVSADYTYNAVPANSNGKTVVFTQKVDSAKYDWKDDTLDTECAAFTEDIGITELEQPPAVGKTMAKPSPKTLKSSNDKAQVVISNMSLTKDITAAVTPYKALNYIPFVDQIAKQIGSTQVTVLAGADVNIADSTGKPTTAEDACFSGTLIFKASNELATATAEKIASAATSNELALIVLKNKMWHKVNAIVTYDEATATITVQNAPASLRLYPFLFIQAPAISTFSVTGTVMESMYPEPTTPVTIAGATVTASLPQVLQALVVDQTAGTITIGGPDTTNYMYQWSLYPIIDGAVDYGVDLLNGFSGASGNVVSGSTTFTVDDQVKSLMTNDGQYLLAVATSHQKQNGIITKSGADYTIQINPIASDALTATSGADGSFTLSGLVQEDQQWYHIKPSKTGYKSYPNSLSGTITNGVLSGVELWMEKSENDKLNGTYAFVLIGNDGTTTPSWWEVYGTMNFDGAGGWTGLFDESSSPDNTLSQGTIPAAGTGKESYEVSSSTYLSLWGPETTSFSGHINALGHTGVASTTVMDTRETLFFTQMGSGYSYASNLAGSDWFLVSYNPADSIPYSNHDRISFDSTGFTSPSQNHITASGLVTLASDGTFTLPATDGTGATIATPNDCSLNGDHDLILCGQVKTAGHLVTAAGVKLGPANSYSESSIAGSYYVSGAVKSQYSTQSRRGTITADGAGNWTGSFTYMDSVSGSGFYSLSGTYTYDPINPGRYVLTETSPGSAVLYCGVSADMATTVCHIYSDPTAAVGIYLGVKAPAEAMPQ